MAHNEGQAFARKIVTSEAYRKRFTERAEAGTLSPAVENHLWDMAYGKPTEFAMGENPDDADLTGLTLRELATRTEQLHQMLVTHMGEEARIAEERARAAAEEIERQRIERENAARQEELDARNLFSKKAVH